MSSHLHLIISRKGKLRLEEIMRDFVADKLIGKIEKIIAE